MSKFLEELKIEINRARNWTYFGRYIESISEYDKIISKLESEIFRIDDRLLIDEWNRLMSEMKFEKKRSEDITQVLLGNFEHVGKKNRVQESESNNDFRANKAPVIQEEPVQKKQRFPYGKEPFKKQVHEDDELYNRKEKELREKQRQEREREREQRDKEFQEKQAEIWPKKKPVAKKTSVKPQNQNNNKSGVNREYNKDWNNNAKKKESKDNKDGKGANKSTFLKERYPDGNGPDINLIEMLERQVIDFNPNIKFSDIAELDAAKGVLCEAVILPLTKPHLFTGLRKPWKGVLLFGPPGTGKTLLAKAIASTGKTTFFNVTASSLASKWKGQSEKLVRILFQMAKFYAPTTIFIDEIDAIASKRGQKQDQSSRKVKTEFMTCIDGATTTSEDGKLVTVIGATNRPWDLDDAIRRRLQKRVHIPLPGQKARRALFNIYLKNEKTDEVDIQDLVIKTDGYSGADIANLCREAAYIPMRREIGKDGGLGLKLLENDWMQDLEKEIDVPMNQGHFIEALLSLKPSVGKDDLKQFEDWQNQFGQKGSK